MLYVIIILKKKQILLSITFCLSLAIIFVLYSFLSPKTVTASTKENTNWGLSFQEKGLPPSGNASIDFLKQYDAYFVNPSNQKTIYLTFDAGYENGYTPQILEALKKHNAQATFFVVGNYIKTSPDLVNKMLEDGHIVGNHTNTHPDMSKISDMESFKNEMCTLENLYKEATGKDIEKFYRPPQGKYCENNLKQAHELGYKTFFWSLAYVDWYVDNQPSKKEAFDKLIPRIHPGAIVLLHSTSKTNAEILDELLTKYEELGYSFGSLRDFT